MKNKAVPFSSELGYSRLFQDFIYSSENLRPFFGKNDLSEAISSVHARKYDRNAIVSLLLAQNSAWQAPDEVKINVEKLRENNAVVIATGQQACLFGGPYFVLLKALGAISKAKEIEKTHGIPVVPLFWIASDDHDYKEISTCRLFDQKGQPVELKTDVKRGLYPPIGQLTYDQSITREIALLESILPDNDFRKETLRTITAHYYANKGIVDAFAEFVLTLLGKYGLVLFNPFDERFKRDISGLMKDIVERHEGVVNLLEKSNKALQKVGYHLQAQKPKSALHLFYHQPHRVALHAERKEFIAGDTLFSKQELMMAIDINPLCFSPDVISRPLAQSFYFPVAAIIGGPAEIAYFAQMMPLFSFFDLATPQIIPRPSVTLIEKRFSKTIGNFHLEYADYTINIEKTISKILGETFPDNIDGIIQDFREKTISELRKIESDLIVFDNSLKDVVTQTKQRFNHNISQLEKKVFAAHKQRHKELRKKLIHLHEHLYPYQSPAERNISLVYFMSRYGRAIIDDIFGQINYNVLGHQLIEIPRSYE